MVIIHPTFASDMAKPCAISDSKATGINSVVLKIKAAHASAITGAKLARSVVLVVDIIL